MTFSAVCPTICNFLQDTEVYRISVRRHQLFFPFLVQQSVSFFNTESIELVSGDIDDLLSYQSNNRRLRLSTHMQTNTQRSRVSDIIVLMNLKGIFYSKKHHPTSNLDFCNSSGRYHVSVDSQVLPHLLPNLLRHSSVTTLTLSDYVLSGLF